MSRIPHALALLTIAALAGTAQAQTLIGGGKSAPTFPIQITQSGSYKLAGHLNVPAGVNGIVIAPGLDVVLDMAGYSIVGAANCSKTVSCYVDAPTGTSGIRVGSGSALQLSNGRIRGFTYYAVWGDTLQLDSLRLTNNGQGTYAYRLMATRVIADNNSKHGVTGAYGSVVDSQALNNGADGVVLNTGSMRGNTAYGNGGFGISGAQVSYQDNAAWGNAGGNYWTFSNAGVGTNNFGQ